MAEFQREAAIASRSIACVLPLAALDRRVLALVGPLALGWLVHRLRRFAAPSPLPNLVTAVRVLLTSALALFELGAAVVVAVFVLDGLDGLLARRFDSTSRQGAHFDMEADGYLVMVVCTLLAERLGPWVLIGGLLRYAFVLVTWLIPSRGEAPRSLLARYAFALSLAGYVSAMLVGAWLPAGLATLVLCASFGRSFLWSLGLYET